MNVRKNLSDLNTYLDRVEDHQNDWLIEHYLSGTAMNSVEVIREELVAMIKAIEDRGAAAAAATAFQQSSVNAPPPISAQPYIVHERFDPQDLPILTGRRRPTPPSSRHFWIAPATWECTTAGRNICWPILKS